MRSKPYIESAPSPIAKLQITFVQDCPENYISIWQFDESYPDMHLLGYLVQNRLVDSSGTWTSTDAIALLKSTIAAWIRGDYHAPLSTVTPTGIEELRTFCLS